MRPSGGGQRKVRSASADLVTAMFDVVRFSRHTRTADPLEPAAGVVLAATARLSPARPSDIACDVRLDLSTVSRHLRNLLAEGYVERTEDPADGRAHRVVPTDAGLEVLEAVVASRAAVLGSALAHWSAADRKTLTTLMRRLADDLAAVDPTPRSTERENR
jgi:DNA-binding MarR family transcriptional regulator